MKYIEVNLSIAPLDPFRDLIVYSLGDEGPYDSFQDTPYGVKAYVPADQFSEDFLRQALQIDNCQVSYQVSECPDKDWNEVWESQHQPVLVEDFCWVRAPFHPHRSDVPFEIEIEPKMSFGTAHHATTYMMLSYLRDLQLDGLRVLDMGCGTAVLAILAAMRGASQVEGVDVDEWAFNNALENIARNSVQHAVRCTLGGAETLSSMQPFDVILANINRNILLNDMPAYVSALKPGGTILFSGFYLSDIPVLQQKAESLGLSLRETRSRDSWAAIRFSKN